MMPKETPRASDATFPTSSTIRVTLEVTSPPSQMCLTSTTDVLFEMLKAAKHLPARKVCKSYFSLTKEYQGRSYDLPVAATTLIFRGYTMLTMQVRDTISP